MTTPTTWFYLPTNNKKEPLLPENTAGKDNFVYLNRWLGRSCGARLCTAPKETPELYFGIVVYPGKHFEGYTSPLHTIDYVKTKNGPLTIVNDMEHFRTMRANKK